MPFEHHEPVDEVRVGRRDEERRVCAHRLADQRARLVGHELREHRDDVVDERLTRQADRSARAEAVTSLVQEKDVEGVGERVSGGQQRP